MITAWHHDEIMERARGAAQRGTVGAIAVVEQRAVELITTGERSGRVYRRGGVSHQASAPGEPPASDSGRLVQSRQVRVSGDGLRAVLAFSALHAWWLEAGTIKMEPRPFARRALFESQEGIRQAYLTEFSVAFRR